LTVALFLALVEGSSRVIWWTLERRVFAAQEAAGHRVLRNDAANFMKVADGRYGYTVRPNFRIGGVSINSDGFHQAIPFQSAGSLVA